MECTGGGGTYLLEQALLLVRTLLYGNRLLVDFLIDGIYVIGVEGRLHVRLAERATEMPEPELASYGRVTTGGGIGEQWKGGDVQRGPARGAGD